MKLLCVGDRGISEEAMRTACSLYLGKAECVTEFRPQIPGQGLFEIEHGGPDSVPVPEQFAKHKGEDFDVLIGSIEVPFSRETIEMFPNLKVIGTCRGGLENVNMEACKERGILVVNAYGRNAEAVSDYTLAMMLSELRNIARSFRDLTVNNGEETWCNNWVSSQYLPHMCESTVGIYGYGYIGKLVAKKVAGFGAKVTVYDAFCPPEKIEADGYIPVSREELFRNSDFVTIHLRLVDATRGIVTKEDIDSMKPHAYFINTARAGLVDYDALLAALKEKRIGGAALDVFPEEPIPADSEWRKLDNCTITAHMAGSVASSRPFAAKIIDGVLAGALDGKDAPQIITKDVLNSEEFKAWAQQQKKEIY